MSRDTDVAWAAGLFEGEGYFANKGKNSFAMTVTSTDLDVLQRLKAVAGGGITALAKREAHHKPSWIWNLYGLNAVNFLKEVRPYLLSRRGARADEVLIRYERAREQSSQKVKIRKEIILLWETGKYSEREIGEITGTNRSYVNAVRMGKLKY